MRKTTKLIPKSKAEDALAKSLLKKGSITLQADTRKDLYRQAEALAKLLPDEVQWTRSIVEFKDGSFFQSYQIVKK